MNKTEVKNCQNCQGEFRIEPEDFDYYQEINVPPPTFCPDCRLQRRLVWRNEYILYKRKCDAPGHTEDIISTFSSDKPFTVYDQKYWWSDNWDPIDYGRDYDFNQPFFTQFKELIQAVPRPSLTGDYGTIINSPYANWGGELKNCYLITDADFVQDSAYGSGVFKVKDCFDCDNITEGELCYSGFNIRKSYRALYSVDCSGCTDIAFCKECVGCNSCFGSINLRSKSYYIFNQPYSKQEYHQKISEILNGSFINIRKIEEKVKKHWSIYPHKHLRGFYNTNSLGDYIYHTKNAKYAFLASNVENSKFVALLHSESTKDCYDYTDWGENAERLYECMSVGMAYNIKLSHLVWRGVRDVEYSYFSGMNSTNLFGCVGLRNKKYCILNKQYSKLEYKDLVLKIKKQMDEQPYKDKKGRIYKYGEFFPIEISIYDYNETAAQEYFSLTKEQVIEQGYTWKDSEKRAYEITMKSENLPDNIKDVKDDILNQVISCEHQGKCNEQCTTAFRIIPEEFQFYKKMKLPLPRLCSNCRHYQRLKHRNPLKLWHRTCQCAGGQSDDKVYQNTIKHFHQNDHCPNEFETTYSTERPEIVYCKKCYQDEVT